MKLNATLLSSAVIAALGGLLFGFDTVVISGGEQAIERLWASAAAELIGELTGLTADDPDGETLAWLATFVHGLAMSAALWGTVLGSLVGAYPADRLGRKRTLLSIGVFYFVSAVWSALAGGVYAFMVARFIGGVGVGVATVVAPLYISEIAPAAMRGRLAGMFQFNIVFGILLAFLSNYLLSGSGPNAWRWMLGVEAAPALVYTLACMAIPESPRWLLAVRNDRAAAAGVLRRIGVAESDAAAEQELDAIAAAAAAEPTTGGFWTSGLARPIGLAFTIAMFNQLSGINAVLYFAPRIFEMTGLAEQSAVLQSVGIGVTNLVFTFVGLALIDRLGRKTLLYIGSVGYIVSLSLCSWAFATETTAIVPACLFAFIAAHAVGQGAVIWVFISEVFPNRHRAAGASLGSGTHWVFCATLTLVFPMAVAQFAPSTVFGFFAAMMVLQLIWVATRVPETKGVPLEELQRELGLSPSGEAST